MFWPNSNCIDTKELGVAASTDAAKSHHLCAPPLPASLFVHVVLEEKKS